MAHIRNGAGWLTADVRQGTRREAVLHSVGSNAEHGLQRTNADKRHAVQLLLNDIAPGCERGKHVCGDGSQCWESWSNREIARRCLVAESSVRNYREEIESSLRKLRSGEAQFVDGNFRRVVDEAIASEKSRTFTNKHGTTATMNVENIGKRDT